MKWSVAVIISAWRFRTSTKLNGQEIHRNIGLLETPRQMRTSPITNLVIAIKSVKIVQYLASDADRWQEDKYAQQQQFSYEVSYSLFTCALLGTSS